MQPPSTGNPPRSWNACRRRTAGPFTRWPPGAQRPGTGEAFRSWAAAPDCVLVLAGWWCLPQTRDVLSVFGPPGAARHPFVPLFLALDLDRQADDRAPQWADAPRGPIQHAVGPQF